LFYNYLGGVLMAGLNSADIFSILEKEIGKKGKREGSDGFDSEPEIVVDSPDNSGTIIHGASASTNSDNMRNKIIAHNFAMMADNHATSEMFHSSDQMEMSSVDSKDNLCTAFSNPEKEGEGRTMKKVLRISQVGEHVHIRVFVDEAELCSMVLVKGVGNSVSFAGVNLSIDGEETVLEI